MKDHLNLFEYYSQKGILPIENNSTRNLGIVIKNNLLALYGLLDMISEKSGQTIQKPAHPDEWFLKLQIKIKNFAKEDIEISNVIAATLTTKNLEFYGEEDEDNETENITDMMLYSKGTLIILEAKRNDFDATNQLKKQITELQQEWERNSRPKLEGPCYISLTWDNIVNVLNDIHTLTEGKDVILNDYIEHIKNSVPAFFPVQTFFKLNTYDTEHIKRRIERFANNYGTDVNLRNKSIEPIYWVKLFEKEYVKELVYQNYNESLALYFFPGNTIGQGYQLFAPKNKLGLLKIASITVQGFELKYSLKPYLKVSDAYARWKYDVDVKTTDINILKKIFKDVCGSKKSSNNAGLINTLNEYKGIISISTFEEGFKEAFKNSEHNYTFIISLTMGVIFENMFETLKKIDTVNPVTPEADKIVAFTKEIEQRVYDLIEN